MLPFVQVIAQKYLVFDNLPKSKRYRFQIGDEFNFRMVSQTDLTTAILTEIGDNYIVLDYLDNIRINQIDHVKIYRNGSWSGIRDVTGYIVPVIGVGYLAIETISNATNNFEPVVRSTTLTVAIVSVVYSLFMQTLKRKTYKINQNHKLFTINLGSGELAPFENN